MREMEERLGTEEREQARSGFSLRKEVFSWLEAIAAAVIAVGIIVTFIGRPILVDGHSMENTLMDGERIITTPLYVSLKHNDIVVIRQKDDVPLVKRVIALAGETVDINYDTGTVYVDGKALEEPFIKEKMEKPKYKTIEFPITVPEGCLFVLGDNRNNSSDSRYPPIGLIDERNVFGKAIFRMWPLNKIGGIDPKDYTY